MICWYCYWGWSEPVAAIYREALAKLDGCESPLDYGPAHLVWTDENFAREHVQWCLDHFSEYAGDHDPKDLEVVRESLVKLLALSDELLAPCPADYDEENPERFPPKVPMVPRPG